MGEGSETIYISYQIRLEGVAEKEFCVELDYDTLDLVSAPEGEPPEWTRLGFHRCRNCPLDDAESHCPVAVNLVDVIEFLKDLVSYEEADVRVETRERAYFARTTLQNVAGSLMGIYMVTSGCPILNKMRPMVETHLPFSSWRETVYRVVSMYIFAQYFLQKEGKTPNWDLRGLVDFYDQVQVVNVGFSERLNAIPFREGDASLNAVSILSSLASMASMTIQDDDLTHWRNIFMTSWGG